MIQSQASSIVGKERDGAGYVSKMNVCFPEHSKPLLLGDSCPAKYYISQHPLHLGVAM